MGEHFDKTVHIGQEDVAVDIGEDQVEKAAHMAQNLLVALKISISTPLISPLCWALRTLQSSMS